MQQRFVDLPLIAEDLGVITPEVEALRDQFDLPGMRVLQFGFAASASEEKVPAAPVRAALRGLHGTHDNDTALGWLNDQTGR